MKKDLLIPVLRFENSSLPFRIMTINSLSEQQEYSEKKPHTHDYYKLIWIINGNGSLHVDLQEYILGNNLLYFVKPGQVHQVSVDTGTQGFILSFTDDFLNLADLECDWAYKSSLSQLFSECQVIRIQEEMVADISGIVMKMIKEFDNQYSFRAHLLSRYFKIFLIYLIRQLGEGIRIVRQKRETELLRSFVDLINKHFKEKKMVTEYASKLSVTPNYLNQIVKTNTGFSASHHIRQRVVLEAKRMCRYSDATMKEIAYTLGFSDSSHFSKFFKTVCGENFSDFKKECLNYILISEQSLTA
jgi:AraC family transcriptional regulator, transcriptional activator of pobA